MKGTQGKCKLFKLRLHRIFFEQKGTYYCFEDSCPTPLPCDPKMLSVHFHKAPMQTTNNSTQTIHLLNHTKLCLDLHL